MLATTVKTKAVQ